MAALGSLPSTFGRYRLLERVGGGGMAVVFRASLVVEGGFEKEVAVKVVREELAADEAFIEMFLDEARLAARLSHANVVQTFDFGQVDGTYFLAMEYVRGRTLAGLLRVCRARQMPLGPARSLHVAAQVARGLHHAHRLSAPDGTPLGLVHRDVSPQNVLVSREGEVKLVDFGIAKAALRSHVTQPGKIRGKCAYMSPEQARGQPLDGRSDLFSLGIVLWESLTGAALFEGESDLAVLEQVIRKEIPAPSRLLPGLPAAVDDAVRHLLARDPDDRPRSADVAARELSEVAHALSRSQADIDLADFQRSLGTGTQVHDSPGAARSPAAAPEPERPPEGGTTDSDDTLPTTTATGIGPGRSNLALVAGAVVLVLLLLTIVRVSFWPREVAEGPAPVAVPSVDPPLPEKVVQPPTEPLVAAVAPQPPVHLEEAPHAAVHHRAPELAELLLSARAESHVSLDSGLPVQLSRLPSRVATTAGRHTLHFVGPNGRCNVRLAVSPGDHLALLLEADGAVFRLNGAQRTAVSCR